MLRTSVKRALVGTGFLAGISGSSALDIIHAEAPDLTRALDHIHIATSRMDTFLVAATADGSDPLSLALLGLALMGVIVKRRSKT